MRNFLKRLVYRIRHGHWPPKIRVGRAFTHTFLISKWEEQPKDSRSGFEVMEDLLWACPRCGDPVCPGPASCLSEQQ